MKRLWITLFAVLLGVLIWAPTEAGIVSGLAQTSGGFPTPPVVAFGGANCLAAGTPCTFSSGPTGNYIRTGSAVYLEVGFTFSALGNGSGAVTIRNLPFTSQNLGADAFGCIAIFQNLQAATDAFYFQSGVAPNSSQINIRYRVSGAETDLLASHLTATTYIKVTCEYPV